MSRYVAEEISEETAKRRIRANIYWSAVYKWVEHVETFPCTCGACYTCREESRLFLNMMQADAYRKSRGDQ